MKRERISRTGVKVLSATSTKMTFYLPKSQNVTAKRKTIYDLFKN